jgi:hypothetical protein
MALAEPIMPNRATAHCTVDTEAPVLKPSTDDVSTETPHADCGSAGPKTTQPSSATFWSMWNFTLEMKETMGRKIEGFLDDL